MRNFRRLVTKILGVEVTAQTPLSTVVGLWPDGTPIRLEDILRHWMVFGRTGSGKSSASGLFLARMLLGIRNCGGLICASKREDLKWWRARFAEAGREGDLIPFGPAHEARFNFVNALGDDKEATACLMAIDETLARLTFSAGEKFWQNAKERGIFLAMVVIRMAYGSVSAASIQRFILGAAASAGQMEDEKWKENFHHQTILKAVPKSRIDAGNLDLAKAFWENEWPNMAMKTRSGILSEITALLFTYNQGVVRELVSTTSTFTLEQMMAGTWVIVDMNPHEADGRFVEAGLKWIFQKALLNRDFEPGMSPCFIHVDEAQNLINKGDTRFLAEGRSHGSAQIMLSQGINSFLGEMTGEHAKERVHALLGNVATMIFHQSDSATAEYGSNLLGHEKEVFVNVKPGRKNGTYDLLSGRAEYEADYSESYQYVLQPRCLMEGLKTGGASCGNVADAWVISASEFADGRRHQKFAFSQI